MNLEQLWDAYCCRLLSFLLSRVSDRTEAEDLLQEVFIRVHQHLCCLPMHEKMDAWIFQITRNLVIDHYRKRHHFEDLPANLPDDFEFEEEDSNLDLSLSIRGMVDELPDNYREALLLTEYQGLSQVELAEKLGLSVSAAKSRVQRAREMLRKMILTCCHVELDRRGKIIDYYENCCCCTENP